MTCEDFPLLPRMAVQLLPPSAQGSAGSTSPSTTPSDASQPGSANPTPTADRCSSATGPVSRCCPTCGKSTQDSAPSTCCTPDTPASRSRRQDAGSERTTPGIFGRPSHEPFAFYDPESSCWKTSQATFDWDSTPSSPTLPKWGWLHGGALYEQPTWEPRTDVHGSLSLPTPQAADGSGGRITGDPETLRTGKRPSGTRASKPLATAIAQLSTPTALLPTPGANDMTGGEGSTREARQESGTGGPALRDIGHLLPTPMSATYEQGGDGGELRAAIQHGPGRRLLPTHRVSATHSSRKSMVENRQWSAPSLAQALEISQGILPREFKNWDEVPGWSGASTGPQSDAGNTPSDGPLPGQLTIKDA